MKNKVQYAGAPDGVRQRTAIPLLGAKKVFDQQYRMLSHDTQRNTLNEHNYYLLRWTKKLQETSQGNLRILLKSFLKLLRSESGQLQVNHFPDL